MLHRDDITLCLRISSQQGKHKNMETLIRMMLIMMMMMILSSFIHICFWAKPSGSYISSYIRSQAVNYARMIANNEVSDPVDVKYSSKEN